ncbi:MAG: hypothetical protein ACPH3C_05820 [Glaciecola sp.]
MVTNKTQQTEFDTFVDHLYDKVFQESADYVSDVVGTSEWGEELHEVHGLIMYNAVKSLAKLLNIK